MHRAKNTLRRLKSISLKRMLHYAGLVKKESGKYMLYILADMVFCYICYGVGYLDYLTFGFIYQDREHRRSFMTMNMNLELVRQLNNSEYRHFFDDKVEFNKTFLDYIGREFIDLRETDVAALKQFLEGKGEVFAKPLDKFGGKGVERVEIDETTDIEDLRERLLKSECYDVEAKIVQHPEMNRLAGSSVNSLRMVTLRQDKKVTLMYSLVRMSDGDSFVDNISSGGMYCPVSISPCEENGEGEITAEAFQDKTGLYFDRHPKSDVLFKGFLIPYYREAIEMVKKAAKVVPGIRYVGWDVAIAPDGPLLIEGNVIPGYDMCQNYRHLGSEKIGILPKFKSVLKEEFPL